MRTDQGLIERTQLLQVNGTPWAESEGAEKTG